MVAVGGFKLGAYPGGQSPADAAKVAQWMRQAAAVSTDAGQAARFRRAEAVLMALVRKGERIPDVEQMLVVRREAVAVLGRAR